MAENSVTSPVFAGRYRLVPVSNDWDRGRSGFTHLVFDIKKEKLAVIKRAEVKSQAAAGLKNEVRALIDLKEKELGVPEVYDTGTAEYGSKNYFYMIIEYIDVMRVEKNLGSLSASERAEILTQLFGLLAKAHQMGIVNGDVDLKHLFWHRDKKQLTVIDWGNAKLNVDPKRKTEFAYDLARAAEIIYSLVTNQGHPAATGTITLPDDTALMPGIAPVPNIFRKLCKWAPRAPIEGAKAPNTAAKLFEVSKKWSKAIHNKIPYKEYALNWGVQFFFVGLLVVAALFLFMSPNSPLSPILNPKTLTPITITSQVISLESITTEPTRTPSPTQTLAGNATITATLEPDKTPATTVPTVSHLTPSPDSYSSAFLVFDNNPNLDISLDDCWQNTISSPLALRPREGFNRRGDKFWSFGAEKDRGAEIIFQSDFSQCFNGQQVGAVSMNVWVSQLESQKEFGLFLEDINGQRREYTFWADRVENLDRVYLRLRESNNTTDNELLFIKELRSTDAYPRRYHEFSILIFFEINNQGLDILYLGEGPLQKSVKVEDIDPNQLIRIDNVVLPTLGTIKTIGLIAHGGEIETAIWPLAFLRK